MYYWKGFHDHMILWNVGITLNSGIIFQVENGVCIITSWYTGTGVSPEIQGIPRIQMSRAHHWGKYLGEPSRDLSPREYSQRVCMCKQAGVLSRVCARSMDKFLHPGHVRPCKWLYSDQVDLEGLAQKCLKHLRSERRDHNHQWISAILRPRNYHPAHQTIRSLRGGPCQQSNQTLL